MCHIRSTAAPAATTRSPNPYTPNPELFTLNDKRQVQGCSAGLPPRGFGPRFEKSRFLVGLFRSSVELASCFKRSDAARAASGSQGLGGGCRKTSCWMDSRAHSRRLSHASLRTRTYSIQITRTYSIQILYEMCFNPKDFWQ